MVCCVLYVPYVFFMLIHADAWTFFVDREMKTPSDVVQNVSSWNNFEGFGTKHVCHPTDRFGILYAVLLGLLIQWTQRDG
jgi:hypothetical protein